MSLLNTIQTMDWTRQDQYDESTGCNVSRDEEGEIELTMDGGTHSVSHRFRDLVKGPCAGLKGAKLEKRIREVMEGFLRDADHFSPMIEEDM